MEERDGKGRGVMRAVHDPNLPVGTGRDRPRLCKNVGTDLAVI
jgi:hypothetical protein